MSSYIVTELRAPDFERVRALGLLSGSGFDPALELARSWATIWVARAVPDGEPLGFALVWRAADEEHLIDLAVDPAFRRRGIARLLLETLVTGATAAGSAVVLLEVRQSNLAALALYAALGFTQTDVRRAYYSDNGEDAVVMRLDLSKPRVVDE